MDGAPADVTPPADAADVIARQQAEIDRLQRRITDSYGQDLRDASATASAAGAIGQHRQLLEKALRTIVATAADIVDSRGGPPLPDRPRDRRARPRRSLESDDDKETHEIRVPLGSGVAGLVALTGHPMAISDTAEDDRDANDIAEAVGFTPKNILCVPLSFEDEVIGVLVLRQDGRCHP